MFRVTMVMARQEKSTAGNNMMDDLTTLDFHGEFDKLVLQYTKTGMHALAL